MELKRKLMILPPILVGIGVLAYLISNKAPPATKPPGERARHVRVIEAAPISVVPSLTGFGAVEPGSKWSAISQIGGEIEYVDPRLKKGAVFKAGDEIIRISPVDFRLAVERAEANIRAAEAKIEELLVSETNARAILDIEQRALEIVETDLKRQRQLLARGTVSQTAVDDKTREMLGQRKTVQDLRNTLRLLPAQRSQQLEQKAVYEAELRSAEHDLARTRIRLPFDARIVDVSAEVAQFAQAGQTLATADGVETAEVEAQVPISRFRNMLSAMAGDAAPIALTGTTFETLVRRMGFEIAIRLKSGGEVIEWPARFARISDTIDPKTRTIGVIAVVDGPYANIVPGKRPPLTKGLFVEMQLRARTVPDQLAVPRAALHDNMLYVVSGENRLEIRAVEPGLYQGDFVTIGSGLKAGELVVVSDLSPAVPGMLLKTTRDDELAATIRRQALLREGGT